MAGYKPQNLWPHRMMSFQCRQADLNRLVMNYLVTEGYQEAAKRFINEACPMMDRFKIKDAMRVGQVQYAMDLATRIYPRLFETDNYVYFHMQQLRLIELISEENINKALSYAKGQSAGHSKIVDLDARREQGSVQTGQMQHTGRHKVPGRGGFSRLRHSEKDSLIKDSSMDPRMMFLIKLILWAQAKLEREGMDYQKLDLAHGDFEEEFRRSFQGS